MENKNNNNNSKGNNKKKPNQNKAVQKSAAQQRQPAKKSPNQKQNAQKKNPSKQSLQKPMNQRPTGQKRTPENRDNPISDIDKYRKYLDMDSAIGKKAFAGKNEFVEMEDVFSDSSMKSAKKQNKFKKTRFYKKWSALAKWKRVMIIVVTALIIVAAIACSVIFGTLNGFRGEKLDKDNLGISDENAYSESGYINIAIFGLDTRSADSFKGRSDSIIIASINKNNGVIKLTSILRDSYVPVEGHSSQKITHAYALGGAKLAVKTINQNYNMNIEDYVTFNFAKLAGLIDLTGGIDIEITETERREMNRIGPDDGRKYTKVQSSGQVHLNGMQAVIYARLRETDSDVKRVERQKKVIMCLVDNIRGMGLTKYDNLIKEAMKFCETSMASTEIISFASMLSKNISIETLVIPGTNTNAIGGMYKGTWLWRYDLGVASNEIHKFIYGSSATTFATSPTKIAREEKTTKSVTTTTTQPSTTQAPVTTAVQPSTTKESTTATKPPTTKAPVTTTQQQSTTETTETITSVEEN